MPWYAFILHILGALLLTNAVPHFVQGISGNPFPTPFSSPPGRANSPPVINVGWGFFNAVVGVLLVGTFLGEGPRPFVDWVLMAIGSLAFALMLGRTFGERRGKA